MEKKTILLVIFGSKHHLLKCVVIFQEHLNDLNNKGLEDTPKPFLVKDQSIISRLEKQAEEFLSAVLSRKGES